MRGRRSHAAPDLARVLDPAGPASAKPGGLSQEGAVQESPAKGPWATLARHTDVAPFREGRGIVLARVTSDALEGFDVRRGDDVVLAARPNAEHGDLAVLPLGAVSFPLGDMASREAREREHNQWTLWKVYPEAQRLRLSRGDGTAPCSAPIDTPVYGVVIGVLRRRNETR